MIHFFFSWPHFSTALEGGKKSGLDFSAFCISGELPMSVLPLILAQIFCQVFHLHQTDGCSHNHYLISSSSFLATNDRWFVVDTWPFQFLKHSSIIETKQCSPILHYKLFFMVLQKGFDQCIWQLTTDCSVLLYALFVDSSSFLGACYVKTKQVASKKLELIKPGFLKFVCVLGFLSLCTHLNATSLSSCLPYAQLSPMSAMLSYSLWLHASILAQRIVPLYSLIN